MLIQKALAKNLYVVAKINVLRYMYPTETLKKLEIVKDELTSEVRNLISKTITKIATVVCLDQKVAI